MKELRFRKTSTRRTAYIAIDGSFKISIEELEVYSGTDRWLVIFRDMHQSPSSSMWKSYCDSRVACETMLQSNCSEILHITYEGEEEGSLYYQSKIGQVGVIKEEAPIHECNCDMFTVIMVKGCQCGGI